MTYGSDSIAAFIEAALWHGSIEQAGAMIAADPGLANACIHTAAVLGDDVAVRRFLSEDPKSVGLKVDPYGSDALVTLCLSRFLRHSPERSPGFVRSAEALLDAGADPNSGFWTKGDYPEFETALYGAAGVARHPELTRLLLDRGADPNDDEVAYHASETDDMEVLQLLVGSGKLSAENLVTMLVRKHDWHHAAGVKYLLEHGADPNYLTRWGVTPLQQAIRRDNVAEIIESLLDHGADPILASHGRSSVAMAARRGRGDLLDIFQRRGVSIEMSGVDRLIAACAMGDKPAVRRIAGEEPALVGEVVASGGTLLSEFAGVGNTEGVDLLLGLGVDIGSRYHAGDGYYGIARESTALHVAAWRGRHDTVKLLIDRGAPVNERDGLGQTPLALAVKACVDSFWTNRRSPKSVESLLSAGASVDGVLVPCGYRGVDQLLLDRQ